MTFRSRVLSFTKLILVILVSLLVGYSCGAVLEHDAAKKEKPKEVLV